jgi:NAD(P) transhydrogenase subunit alpha
MAPDVVPRLQKLGLEVLIQTGAGAGSHFNDTDFGSVTLVDDPQDLYAQANVILKVQPPSAEEIDMLQAGTVLVGMMLPHRYPERIARLRDRRITTFAMELIPRISRAQAMDTLSSQASVAGYRSALMAASLSGKFFPMLTTAAGTIRPSTVLVLGIGVAGLQAIATAKRLGAIVEAYDVRSATREQAESLGARFIDTGVSAEAEGGYARELTEAEKAKQKEVVDRHIAKADCVITTAAIPGRPAPRLIDAATVQAMGPGAVVVDLAAEGGGNCELTRPGETIEHHGVTIHGPLNVPASLPVHASEMFAKNLLNFISPMIEDGELKLDWDDEVIAESCLTFDGEIKHEPTKKLVEQQS